VNGACKALEDGSSPSAVSDFIMRDIHELSPGQIGVVAHDLKPYVWNAWIENHEYVENNPFVSMFGSVPIFNNKPLILNFHIPHGNFVLVLSEPLLLATIASIKDSKEPFAFYYKVLWGEEVCWIEKKYLINPYYT
jgi:hypothetical protein